MATSNKRNMVHSAGAVLFRGAICFDTRSGSRSGAAGERG
jgi:hypothetical protein